MPQVISDEQITNLTVEFFIHECRQMFQKPPAPAYLLLAAAKRSGDGTEAGRVSRRWHRRGSGQITYCAG